MCYARRDSIDDRPVKLCNYRTSTVRYRTVGPGGNLVLVRVPIFWISSLLCKIYSYLYEYGTLAAAVCRPALSLLSYAVVADGEGWNDTTPHFD